MLLLSLHIYGERKLPSPETGMVFPEQVAWLGSKDLQKEKQFGINASQISAWVILVSLTEKERLRNSDL